MEQGDGADKYGQRVPRGIAMEAGEGEGEGVGRENERE